MAQPRLGMRQVHLDFHTAPGIPDVGRDFDPVQFAATMKAAHVDSVTVFARCHHGLCYYPTKVGQIHPALTFDLLGAQIEALHRVGIRAPIYITVGWDELMAEAHPEWLLVDRNGRMVGRGPLDAMGWRMLDLASPYTDYVFAQTEEVLQRYAPVDGIFFDIIRQDIDGAYSTWRLRQMRRDGVDETDREQTMAWGLALERRFVERAYNLVRASSPEATIFFNSRLRPDRNPQASSRAEMPWYTHIEIESLPSVQWGYNHYPLFAAYYQTLGKPLLGMTGIFHKSWADFGGLKPEVALHYECARMAATGAVCSVGDQLHPRGVLDAAAYDRLGAVYGRLEALEPWLRGAQPVTEIGVFLAEHGPRFHTVGRDIDEGAMRILLELHRPFQFLDKAADFSPYRMLILPDALPVDPEFAAKLQVYVDGGGALLLSHRAGLAPDGQGFALDAGVEYRGDAPHSPDFFVAGGVFSVPLTDYYQVLYDRGSQVRALPSTEGALPGTEVLAHVGYPYFTRTHAQFMSHKHTPYDRTSDDVAVSQRGRIIYCHSPLFGAYRRHAVPYYREIVRALLQRLAPQPVIEAPDLPTTAEVGLLRQPGQGNRAVLHLIHAVPQRRGEGVEIVEDVLPLYQVRVGLRLDHPVTGVTLAPGGERLPFETVDGVTWVTVPEVKVHQVVAFE
ncbi:MAG: alpha-L-fucosidase [Chloroflexi bacterium]|nr:alpha-L-fucosidase [Chloroflexota bacterium]